MTSNNGQSTHNDTVINSDKTIMLEDCDLPL